MTMSLEELSDRLEIQDLLVSYSHAIDTRDWEALDAIFTADAVVDYSAMGGSRGDLAATKAFLSAAMEGFVGFQHLIAPALVALDGDEAVGRTMCHNPMVLDAGEGRTRTVFCGLWYVDRFVRTAAGWRIRERVEERCYLPPDFQGGGEPG